MANTSNTLERAESMGEAVERALSWGEQPTDRPPSSAASQSAPPCGPTEGTAGTLLYPPRCTLMVSSPLPPGLISSLPLPTDSRRGAPTSTALSVATTAAMTSMLAPGGTGVCRPSNTSCTLSPLLLAALAGVASPCIV